MHESEKWKWSHSLRKVKVKSLSHSVRLLATPWTAAYRLLHPWDFPGKSTGVGCHCLLRFTLLPTPKALVLKETFFILMKTGLDHVCCQCGDVNVCLPLSLQDSPIEVCGAPGLWPPPTCLAVEDSHREDILSKTPPWPSWDCLPLLDPAHSNSAEGPVHHHQRPQDSCHSLPGTQE